MSAKIVDLAGERRCVCGHPRREHEFCSDDYPALCVHQETPVDRFDWGVCP